MKKLQASSADIRRAAVATLERERANSALLSIAFVGTTAMKKLNTKYLQQRSVTDVISFAFQSAAGGSATLGDIYICPGVARANAKRQKISVREEVLRLVVHGVLHVLGRDHPEGDARTSSAMWRRQEEIVATL